MRPRCPKVKKGNGEGGGWREQGEARRETGMLSSSGALWESSEYGCGLFFSPLVDGWLLLMLGSDRTRDESEKSGYINISSA